MGRLVLSDNLKFFSLTKIEIIIVQAGPLERIQRTKGPIITPFNQINRKPEDQKTKKNI